MKKTYGDYGYHLRTVRLDEESAEIATHIPNVSKWTREQLKAWAREQEVPTHVNVQGQGFARVCNPFHTVGLCSICWPDGRPTREDWTTYLVMSREGLEPKQPKSAGSFGANHTEAHSRHQKTNQNPLTEIIAWAGWLILIIAVAV